MPWWSSVGTLQAWSNALLVFGFLATIIGAASGLGATVFAARAGDILQDQNKELQRATDKSIASVNSAASRGVALANAAAAAAGERASKADERTAELTKEAEGLRLRVLAAENAASARVLTQAQQKAFAAALAGYNEPVDILYSFDPEATSYAVEFSAMLNGLHIANHAYRAPAGDLMMFSLVGLHVPGDEIAASRGKDHPLAKALRAAGVFLGRLPSLPYRQPDGTRPTLIIARKVLPIAETFSTAEKTASSDLTSSVP